MTRTPTPADPRTQTPHRTATVVRFAMIAFAASMWGGTCVPMASTMPTEGTVRDPVRSTSVSGAAAYLGDLLSTGPSVGGGVRGAHQVVRNVAVGADLVGAGPFNVPSIGAPPGSPPAPPQYAGVISGRAFGRFWPDTDHVSFSAGLGGAGFIWPTGSQASFLADVGVRVGVHHQRVVEGFLGESVSLGVVPGSSGANATAWFYFLTEFGALVRPTPRLAIGAALTMAIIVTSDGRGGGSSVSGGAWRPAFLPGLFVRYTFGGER